MLKRGFILALAGLLIVVTLTGIYSGGLFRQHVWDPGAPWRLAILAAMFAVFNGAILWWKPYWYIAAMLSAGALIVILAGGAAALAGLLWFGLSCYALGAIWMRRQRAFVERSPHLTLLIGLALWILFVALTVRWHTHYAAVYWLLPAAPVYIAFRYQYVPEFRLATASSRRDLVWYAVVFFALLCHLAAVLKPEASSDGLSVHLVAAARVGSHHFWPFNVDDFVWAVMPMNGDWAFAIGWLYGREAGARLMNFALLCLIGWILYERLHARIPRWITCLLIAAFLCTPLVWEVTGSLYVENFVALMILGSLLCYRAYLKEKRAAVFYACALLAGTAAGAKFGALAYVIPILLACCVKGKLRHVVCGIPLALAVGSLPYLEAWTRTGNPVFPFFNGIFHSPNFEQSNFVEHRFHAPLNAWTWYDMTFRSSRYLEGQDGSLGFLFFLTIPLVLLGIRRRWPRTGFVCLWVSFTGFAISFASQTYLRYIYASLPLWTLLAGMAIATFRARDERLGNFLGGVAAAALALNLAFLPAASWRHKDFSLDVFTRAGREAYLVKTAPVRLLADYLTERAPAAGAAWMEGSEIAPFPGRAFSNTWHSQQFWRRLRESAGPAELALIAQERRIEYFIAPSADSRRPLTNVHSRLFLEEYTSPVWRAGDMELRKWDPARLAGVVHREHFAPPGTHDELGPYSTYQGSWIRDVQFREAYQGTLAYANNIPSRVIVRFEGTSIRLIHTAADNRCTALVSLDDGPDQVLSEYSPRTIWQKVSPPFRASVQGKHWIRVRSAQEANWERAQGCYVDLDGFIVE